MTTLRAVLTFGIWIVRTAELRSAVAGASGGGGGVDMLDYTGLDQYDLLTRHHGQISAEQV